MTTIATRLPDELVRRLDELVATGTFRTRSEALRHAIEALLADVEHEAISAAIVEGYRRLPAREPHEDVRARAIASIKEEAW